MQRAVWGVVGSVWLSLAGCATGPSDLAQPRIRVGGLPYPGFTNYLPLDPPDALGAHRYQRLRSPDDPQGEVSAGIVYTRHAGFLDLAHVRSTVDWVRYVYLVALDRLMAQDPASEPPLRWSWLGMDYRMDIRPPQDWTELSTAKRLPLARQAAAVLAQRLATTISTWHEVGSWHGQMIVPPFQEIRSAFTWDDSSSHVFAALVGGRALASGDPHQQDAWNRAVTRELARALAAQAPVGLACQNEALSRSQRIWWHGGQTLRRDLDTGLQGPGPKQPWRVADLPCAEGVGLPAGPVPMPLLLPGWQGLEQAGGVAVESWFQWEVTLPYWLTQRVLGCEEACKPHVFKGESGLLAAIDHIRMQLEQASGADALRPDAPPSAGAARAVPPDALP